MNVKTLKELKAKLTALGELDEDTKKSVVCSHMYKVSRKAR